MQRCCTEGINERRGWGWILNNGGGTIGDVTCVFLRLDLDNYREGLEEIGK